MLAFIESYENWYSLTTRSILSQSNGHTNLWVVTICMSQQKYISDVSTMWLFVYMLQLPPVQIETDGMASVKTAIYCYDTL